MPFGIIFAGLVIGVLFPWHGVSLALGAGAAGWMVGSAWAITGVVVGFGLLTNRIWFRPLGLAAALLLIVEGIRQVLSRGDVIEHVLVVAGAAAFVAMVVPAFRRPPVPADSSAPARRSGYASTIVALCGVVGLTAHVAWGARSASSSGATNRWNAAREFPSRPNAAGARPVSIAGADQTSPGVPAPNPNPGASREAPGVQWASFSKGLAEARTRQAPIFVEFYATWCGACKSMDRNAFRDEAVTRKLREMVAVRVNAEEQTPRDGLKGVELANRFRVEAYPTLLILDPKGKELARLVGAPDARGFLRWLESAVTGNSGSATGT